MTLKELIESMPGYVDANDPTDAAVLAWLRADVGTPGPIGSRILLRWGAANDRLDKLEAAHKGNASAAVRSLAQAALLTVQRPDTELDMGDASHVALVDALVTAGVLSTTDKDELVALATTTAPRMAGQREVPADIDDDSWLHHIAVARAL